MSIQSETLTKAFLAENPSNSQKSTAVYDKFEANKNLDGKFLII